MNGLCLVSHGIVEPVVKGSLNSCISPIPFSSDGYNPVSGSGTGAVLMSSVMLRTTSPMWSFELILSQSSTPNWRSNLVS